MRDPHFDPYEEARGWIFLAFIIIALALAAGVALNGCAPMSTEDRIAVARSEQAIGAIITVNDNRDLVFTSTTVCGVRNAFLAARLANAQRGGCAAGIAEQENIVRLMVGTATLTLAGTDNLGLNGDFDIAAPVRIECAGAAGTCILNGNGVDRLLHGAASLVELVGVTLKNGAVNGGTGLVDAPGSVASGGCMYFVGPGTLILDHVRMTGCKARTGGGFNACTGGSPTPPTVLATDSEFDENDSWAGGGGGGFTHVPMFGTRLSIHNNRTHGQSVGGGWHQGNFRMQCDDCSVMANSALDYNGGGLAATGEGGAGTVGTIVMNGGMIAGNAASGSGGGFEVASGQGGTESSGSWCSADPAHPGFGCGIELWGTTLANNGADAFPTWPTGSGGQGRVNGTGTAPGRCELHGVIMTGGTDPSAPSIPGVAGACTQL